MKKPIENLDAHEVAERLKERHCGTWEVDMISECLLDKRAAELWERGGGNER